MQSSRQYIKKKDFFLFPIVATYNDQLIALVDVSAIKEYLNMGIISEKDIKKWGLERLRDLDYEDNPILIFYTMKK